MLWIIEGNDIAKKNRVLQKITDKVSPDNVLRFDSVSEEVRSFKDTQDIFGETRLVVVGVTPFAEFESDFDGFHTSQTHFVIHVEKLLAPQKRKIQDIEVFACHPDKKQEDKFNIFALTDALVARNKKDLWVLYQQATREGVSSQEVINILLWQAKTMLLVTQTTSAESGLKPFVYNKTKRALQKYSSEDIEKLNQNFISLHHNSRRGEDLDIGLEKLLLTL